MKFLIKPAIVFSDRFSFNYEQPSICPHCGYSIDAKLIDKTYYDFDGNLLLLSKCRCTNCEKSIFFADLYDSEQSDIAKNVALFPSREFERFENERLMAISPRFVDMYNQAKQAEFHKSFELAAIGYRSALEILVKDFAIKELGKDEQEVANKKLFSAIGEYLQLDQLVATADVVRVLGNDFTHYKRKHPEFDFELLKDYMDIFISQIDVMYKVKHPPVGRLENSAPKETDQT